MNNDRAMRCDTCADWRDPDPDGVGECWSGDRLDGDMSKGPAGYSYGRQVCEAWRPTPTNPESDLHHG